MDDVEGVYKVEFDAGKRLGHGVIILENGTLRGGDTAMFYLGSYSHSGDQISAEVVIDVHSKTPGWHQFLGFLRQTYCLTEAYITSTLAARTRRPLRLHSS